MTSFFVEIPLIQFSCLLLVCPLLCYLLHSVVVYLSPFTWRRLNVESASVFVSSFVFLWWVQFPSSFPNLSTSPAVTRFFFEHHVSWSSQPQSAFTLFSKTTRPRALFTRCLLSKKACLYAGADWLTSSVSQRVARGPLCAVYSLHGFGIAQLIERLTRDRKVADLTAGKYGGRLFLSSLNSLCWVLCLDSRRVWWETFPLHT